MTFARYAYRIIGAWGVLVSASLYFARDTIARMAPPAVTHAEFYYGFVGLVLLWQLVFFLIASDPARYRPLMPITILEKLVYGIPCIVLFAQGQLDPRTLAGGLLDMTFGIFFAVAYFRTSPSANLQ